MEILEQQQPLVTIAIKIIAESLLTLWQQYGRPPEWQISDGDFQV